MQSAMMFASSLSVLISACARGWTLRPPLYSAPASRHSVTSTSTLRMLPREPILTWNISAILATVPSRPSQCSSVGAPSVSTK